MLEKSDGATIAASVAMMASVTNSSISVNPRGRPASRRRSILDDTHDLLDCGESGLDLLPTVDSQRLKSGVGRERPELRARRARRDRVAEIVGEGEQLEYAK